jgi:tetratricopeptide (TPR) repeat protein
VRHRHGGRAARAVDAALAAYPRHAELLLLRGNLAYQLVEHDRAVACYEACSRAAPGDWRPLLNLGQLWVVLRQWERALPVLERAVTLGAPTTAQELVAHCREKLARKVADSSRTGR